MGYNLEDNCIVLSLLTFKSNQTLLVSTVVQDEGAWEGWKAAHGVGSAPRGAFIPLGRQGKPIKQQGQGTHNISCISFFFVYLCLTDQLTET